MNNKGYSPSWSGSNGAANNRHFVATIPPNIGLPNDNVETNGKKQDRAMSMQISSYPFSRPPTKEEFFEQRRRQNSASKSHSPHV